MKKFPTSCPSCDGRLKVKSLECTECETHVQGDYELPMILVLTREEQEFVISFVKESGRLNVMAKNLNLSYPTVRNKLDDLIDKIKRIESEEESKKSTS